MNPAGADWGPGNLKLVRYPLLLVLNGTCIGIGFGIDPIGAVTSKGVS